MFIITIGDIIIFLIVLIAIVFLAKLIVSILTPQDPAKKLADKLCDHCGSFTVDNDGICSKCGLAKVYGWLYR